MSYGLLLKVGLLRNIITRLHEYTDQHHMFDEISNDQNKN